MPKECEHVTDSKFLVVRGPKEHQFGFLSCEACLTDEELAKYVGWRERLAAKRRKAEQACVNFHNGKERSEIAPPF